MRNWFCERVNNQENLDQKSQTGRRLEVPWLGEVVVGKMEGSVALINMDGEQTNLELGIQIFLCGQ